MYDKDAWQNAFEEAQLYGWDEIDVGERASELAKSLVSIYERQPVDRDDFILQATIDAAALQFDVWGGEEFKEVVDSFIGSTVDEIGGSNADRIRVHSDITGETYEFRRIR